ncbi:MAG: hypothetical protein RBT11_06325 [Desulfobacterales bacterium]|nr:hypothetical protein [Desulfobacterales bacterium]
MNHSLSQAGAPHLSAKELKATLVDHAAGNLSLLNAMAAQLRVVAA